MFCGKCGKELNPGASFCPRCGAKVAGSRTPSSPATGTSGFGTPASKTPASKTPTGSSVAYASAGGAAASADSKTSGSFPLRMAEGVVSCLNIILALALPVLSISISSLFGINMQMNILDVLQAPTKLEQMSMGTMGAYASPFGGGMSGGGSAAQSSPFSSLAATCGIIGFVFVVAVACSALNAFLCFTKNSEKKYPAAFAMAVYAIVFMAIVSAVSSQMASQLSGMGVGHVDTSSIFQLEIGIWAPLIGGIVCIVLDFMRASRAKSEKA